MHNFNNLQLPSTVSANTKHIHPLRSTFWKTSQQSSNTSKPLRNLSRVNFRGRACVQIFTTIFAVSQPYWELFFSVQSVPEALPAWTSRSVYRGSSQAAEHHRLVSTGSGDCTMGRRDVRWRYHTSRGGWCRITTRRLTHIWCCALSAETFSTCNSRAWIHMQFVRNFETI